MRKKMHASLAVMLLCGTILTGIGNGLPAAYAQEGLASTTAANSSASVPIREKVMAKNAAAKTIDLEFKGTVGLSDTLTVEQQFGSTVIAKSLSDVMVGAENVDVYLGNDGKAAKIVIVGDTPLNRMRVGIRKDISNIADMTQIDHPQINMKSAQGYRIKDKTASRQFDITAGTEVTFTAGNGQIVITQNGAELLRTVNRLYIEPASVDSLLQVTSITRAQGKPQYRGVFELFLNPAKDKLRLINELDIEKYLYQVVPSEMPSSFGLEALKAQSIAARTYALTDYLTSRFADRGFHIDDSTLSQVYNNTSENALTSQAVDATTGKIMKNGSQLVDARFYSTSGGYGASKHEVWHDVETNQFPGTPLPYLTGRSYTYDPANNGNMLNINTSNEQALNAFYKNLNYKGYDSDSLYFRWKVSLTKSELEKTVNKNILLRYAADPLFILTKDTNGSFVSKPIPVEGAGTISNMYVSRRGAGGNAMELVIEGSTGTFKIVKEFNIRFTIRPNKTDTGSATDVLAYRAKGGAGAYDQAATLKNPSILYSAFLTFDLIRDGSGNLSEVTFYGGGNGHGVGMSQFGAQMLGNLGWSYDRILDAYYKGMQLTDLNAFRQPSAVLTGPSSVLTGQPFTVNFGLHSVTSNVYAQDITIEYNTDIADYVSSTSMKPSVEIVTEKAVPGKIRLILASPGNAVNGDAELVKLSFLAKTVTQGTYGTISVTGAMLGDDQGRESQVQLATLNVTVTTPPPGLPGDSNGDNKFSIGDLSFAAAHYGKNSSSPDWNQIKTADIDSSGNIDISDIAAIAQKILE
ncbi:SpoIID/LytB domain-containing protein [Paenibacillus sp. WST5]|uniref:SpoIID/LytB domain-containing protein n=1 Tax=Paenibacillus sedimenti TaxID=2770274 RepID=A0A926KME3_9BACL|nr:SpoIID/LytB domain-containing protein [Paenibacillus sedimenti]